MTDLCPGYRVGKKAEAGRCCCGLHWRGEMPMHTEGGHVFKDPQEYMRRLFKRADKRAKAAKTKARVIADAKERLVYK